MIQPCGHQEIESGCAEFEDPGGPENPVPLTPTWIMSKQARELTGTPILIRREAQEEWTKILATEGCRIYGCFTVEIRKEGAGMMLLCVTSSIRQVIVEPSVRFDLQICSFSVSQYSFLGGDVSRVARAVSVEFRDLCLDFERRPTEKGGSRIRMFLVVSRLRGSADYLSDRQYFFEAMDDNKFEGLCDVSLIWDSNIEKLLIQMQTLCPVQAEIYKSQQIWVRRIDLKTPAIHLRVDDRLFQLYAHFRSLYKPIYHEEELADAKRCNDVNLLHKLHTQALSLLIPRVYIETLTIGQIQVFVDVHLSRAAGLPVAVDTDKYVIININ